VTSNDGEPLSLTEVVYRAADELRSQACQGLRFTKGEYDRPAPGSEALDVGFFAADSLPPLSAGHERLIPVVKLFRGDMLAPYFDPASLA